MFKWKESLAQPESLPVPSSTRLSPACDSSVMDSSTTQLRLCPCLEAFCYSLSKSGRSRYMVAATSVPKRGRAPQKVWHPHKEKGSKYKEIKD